MSIYLFTAFIVAILYIIPFLTAMATQDFADKGDQGYFSIIRNGFVPKEYDKEIVRLQVGGDTARVGMAVSYIGKVTAATPGTHRDVGLAAAGSAAANEARAFAGFILRPVPLPLDTVPLWTMDTLLIDGTYVEILKATGGRAKISVFVVDQSADLLPGLMLGLSSTAGMLQLLGFTFSATPTVTELEANLGALLEKAGVVADVEEDVGGTDLITNMWF